MAQHAASIFTLALVSVSLAYSLFALFRVVLFRRGETPSGAFAPPVTILKPVCGLDPALFDCLRSFCEQDYPAYQVVFGVRDADDPALPVIERLIRESAHRDLALVVDGRLHGWNRKLSNLANMMRAARHDVLVVADSDIRVAPTYLRSVVAPFQDRKVGAVTCLYVGTPIGGLASVVGASFINDWFLPSVLVAVALEKLAFCFGQTMAVRRDVLESIGGFAGLAPYLADDYMLGRLVSNRGFAVRLASNVIENVVFDANFEALFRHELRWARTFRTVRPIGYALSAFTDTTALAVLFLLASGGSALGFALFGAAIVTKIGLHTAVRRRFGIGGPARPWLVPVRDLLCFALRVASYFGRDVEWKTERFVVLPSGRLEARGEVTR